MRSGRVYCLQPTGRESFLILPSWSNMTRKSFFLKYDFRSYLDTWFHHQNSEVFISRKESCLIRLSSGKSDSCPYNVCIGGFSSSSIIWLLCKWCNSECWLMLIMLRNEDTQKSLSLALHRIAYMHAPPVCRQNQNSTNSRKAFAIITSAAPDQVVKRDPLIAVSFYHKTGLMMTIISNQMEDKYFLWWRKDRLLPSCGFMKGKLQLENGNPIQEEIRAGLQTSSDSGDHSRTNRVVTRCSG